MLFLVTARAVGVVLLSSVQRSIVTVVLLAA